MTKDSILSSSSLSLISSCIGLSANYNFYIEKYDAIYRPSPLEHWLILEKSFFCVDDIIVFRSNLLCRGLVNKPHEPFGFFLKYSSYKNVLNLISFSTPFKLLFRSLYQEFLVYNQTYGTKYKKKLYNDYSSLLDDVSSDKSAPPSFVQRLTSGDTLVGQPRYHISPYNNLPITESFVRHASIINLLRKYLPILNLNSIIEIGSGFGGIAEIITSSSTTLSSYSCIDFPQRLTLAAFYLSQSLNPAWKINISKNDFFQHSKCINLIPLYMINNLAIDVHVDCVLNTHSFQEMSIPQVENYTDLIARLAPTYVVSLNRTKHINDYEISPSSILSQRLQDLYSEENYQVNSFVLSIFTKR